MDLATIEEIRQVKYRYLRCVDLKLWDELAEVFTPDATVDYGTQVYGKPLKLAGRDEIVGFLRDKLGPDMITVHRAGQPEITVDGDVARAVHGDHVRTQLVPQEPDDLVPAGELQRLAVHLRAVVHGGVRREHLRELVPQLQVDTAQIAVLHLTDLFDRGKVHMHKLGASD